MNGECCMSKNHLAFVNETGKTAFLAGVVDVLSDNLQIVLDFSYAIDIDIFYIKDSNLSLLNDSVKKRLLCYKQYDGFNISEDKINALNFKLTKINTDVHDFICEQLKSFCSDDNLSDAINEFLNDLNWYLQKPLCIYKPERMPDKNIDILGGTYMYVAWNYFFISYYDYLVLFVLGTDE